MKFKEPISNLDDIFQERNDLFFILNETFQETLPLLNITINQTAWFDADRWANCIFVTDDTATILNIFLSFEISNTEMKFELTKSEEDLPFIECDIDSFVEYQFQDFFLSEPRRLKPIVENVQELINTFIAEIENRNERQVKKLISN